jgi:flagellin
MATVDITRIASNIGALNALNSLQTINAKLAMHQTRLSTGKRINSAADDPAGLTIATKMLARSEGLKVTLDNIGDAKNMLSVAEGGLSKMTDIITQMRNKAEQAASDTLGSSERGTIQTQLSSYAQQLQDIIDQTKWNGVKLLDNTTGTKTFQTGVDELETTLWTLPSAMDPATLKLSKQVATADTAVSSANSSFANVATKQVEASGTLNNMSEIGTGDYTFTISGLATSASAGSAALESSSKLITGVKALAGTSGPDAADDAAGLMTSGRYKLAIDKVNADDDVEYTITNRDDSPWHGGTGALQVTAADITAGDVVNQAGDKVGLKLDFTDATNTAANLVAGQSMTFEYIAKNEVKLAMTDSSGTTLQVNRVGADGTTNYSASSAYVAAGGSYVSGRGASVEMATVTGTLAATFAKGDKASFTYEQANNFSVNVSNSAKAGQYMTTVNSALDRVTSALSDLGSLMARLTFKEDSVATAQINVEASYNRIMNANMAEEQMNASKFAILQQTGIAMLAQANQAPQNLLSLFR